MKVSPTLFSKSFIYGLFGLALPIALQQTLTAAFNLVDVGMVGQLGDRELGTVGLITKIFFVTSHILIGLASGTTVLSAQYFGKKSHEGCRKVLALSLTLSIAITFPITLLAWLFPQTIMSWLSSDPATVALGASYMQITAPYHLLTGIVMAYAASLRSIRNPKLPLLAGIISIALNTFLNYLLIFGTDTIPAMGIEGAGYATVIARLIECLLLFAGSMRSDILQKLRWADFRNALRLDFFKRIMRPTLPIIGGEYIWSTGIFAYYMIYGRMGTHELAAMSMLEPIEGLFIQFFLGFGTACSIILGNDLGAGLKNEAFGKSKGFLLVIPFAGLLAGMLMVYCRGPILSLFLHLSPQTLELASDLFIIMGTALFIKIFNMLSMFGILRSGGDTRYMMIIDTVCMWGIGVPLAAFSALVLDLPLRWVYLLILCEELIKACWSYRRIKSGKWLNNLVE